MQGFCNSIVSGPNNFGSIAETTGSSPSASVRLANSARPAAAGVASAIERESQTYKRRYPLAMPSPELPTDITAHRKPAEYNRLADRKRIQRRRQIVGVFVHQQRLPRIIRIDARGTSAESRRSARSLGLACRSSRFAIATSCGRTEIHAPAAAALSGGKSLSSTANLTLPREPFA